MEVRKEKMTKFEQPVQILQGILPQNSQLKYTRSKLTLLAKFCTKNLRDATFDSAFFMCG
uniref:Uncharacterized protein n=1 Tax=Romanomermis culicivorax TaxID=13658 RepID=A0A915HF52_ROMCU